jgi:hypothetical protein
MVKFQVYPQMEQPISIDGRIFYNDRRRQDGNERSEWQ